MKRTVEFKDWTPDEAVRGFVRTQISKLDRRLKAIPGDAIALRVVIDRKVSRTLYRVVITLDLPGPDIATVAQRHDLKEAVHDAIAEIRRQLEKQRRKRTHTYDYKRPPRRERLKQMRAEP